MTFLKRRSCVALMIAALVPAASWADLTNTATATYQDASNNSYNATSNTVTVTVTASVTPVITLTESANPTTANSGTTVTFTTQYQNTTSGIASNVVLTDQVPAGSTLVAGSISNGGTVNGTTITWTIGTVPANGSGSVNFKAKVN